MNSKLVYFALFLAPLAAVAQAPVTPGTPAATSAPAAQSNGRIRAEVVTQTSVRRNPDSAGEALGVYRPGTRLVIVSAGIAGWYRVDFPKEVKGTRIGWIAAADVDLLNPDGTRVSGAPPAAVAAAPAAPSGKKKAKAEAEQQPKGGFPYQYRKVSLGLVGAGWMFTPADIQALLGEPSKKAIGMRFGLEVQYQAQRGMGGALQLLYVKASSGGLSLSGFEFRLLANYEFWGTGGWKFGVGAGPIGTFYSATVTSGGAEVKTSGIIAAGAVGMLQVSRFFSSRISLGLGAGYQYLVVSQLPTISVGPPLSQDVTANLNLSGPTAQLALRFHL